MLQPSTDFDVVMFCFGLMLHRSTNHRVSRGNRVASSSLVDLVDLVQTPLASLPDSLNDTLKKKKSKITP